MNKVNFYDDKDPNKVTIHVAKTTTKEEVTEVDLGDENDAVETVESVETVELTETQEVLEEVTETSKDSTETPEVEETEEVEEVIETDDTVEVKVTKTTVEETIIELDDDEVLEATEETEDVQEASVSEQTEETTEEVTEVIEPADTTDVTPVAAPVATSYSDTITTSNPTHPVKEWSADDFKRGAEEYVKDNGEFDWDAKEAEIEEAINRDFDETYADYENPPFYKRAWFWIVAVLVVAAAVVGVLIHNGTIPNPVKLLSYDPNSGVTVETVKKEEQVDAQQFILPEGAVVKEASDGTWGVYEGTTLLTSYNGIASNGYGTWYIKDGKVDFSFTGKVTVNGKTYNVEKGRVNITSNEPEETTTQSTEGMAYNEGTDIQEEAKDHAEELLDEMAYSRDWLIAQLVADGYNKEDATWAVDNTRTNWNYQAYLKAREYLRLTSFNHQDMVDQLVFEGFTEEQATYAANRAGL